MWLAETGPRAVLDYRSAAARLAAGRVGPYRYQAACCSRRTGPARGVQYRAGGCRFRRRHQAQVPGAGARRGLAGELELVVDGLDLAVDDGKRLLEARGGSPG